MLYDMGFGNLQQQSDAHTKNVVLHRLQLFEMSPPISTQLTYSSVLFCSRSLLKY